MKRGRKSAEELGISVIDVQRQRLTPPDYLNAHEAEIFRSIVDNCDPLHFRKSELPVLCSYVTAVNLSRWRAHKVNEGDQNHHKQWLECTKLVALLRLDKRSVERNGCIDADVPRRWDRRAADRDDD